MNWVSKTDNINTQSYILFLYHSYIAWIYFSWWNNVLVGSPLQYAWARHCFKNLIFISFKKCVIYFPITIKCLLGFAKLSQWCSNFSAILHLSLHRTENVILQVLRSGNSERSEVTKTGRYGDWSILIIFFYSNVKKFAMKCLVLTLS